MKTLSTLTALALLTPTVAFAKPVMHTVNGDPSGFTEQEACYRFEYREEYVPGTSQSPGYVKTSDDKVEVPCGSSNQVGTNYQPRGNSNEVGTNYQPHTQPVYNQPSNSKHNEVYVAHHGQPTITNVQYYPATARQYQPQPDQQYYQATSRQYQPQPEQQVRRRGRVDDNDCTSGTVLGAIAGAAGAFGLTNGGSYNSDHLWTVPLGMIGGSMIGCQLNGG